MSIIKPLMMNPCITIIVPMAAPIVNEPTLPQKIFEGYLSYRKYAKVAPVMLTTAKMFSTSANMTDFRIRDKSTITERPDASPL